MSFTCANCTDGSMPAALISFAPHAKSASYFMTAGMICFFAMSIAVSASMLITFAYSSYLISARDSNSFLDNTPCFSNILIVSSFTNEGMASTVVLKFGSPRRSASFTHSSEYPLPLNTILLCSVMYFLIRSCTAISKLSAFSSSSANSANTSATIVFKIMFGLAMDAVDPNIRNSNLLPVKANGEVRLRSVASFWKSGRVFTPESSFAP